MREAQPGTANLSGCFSFTENCRLTQAIQEAERKRIFTYEAVYEIIQRMTGNVPRPFGRAPGALEGYKVKVTDIHQYRQLVKEANR